LLLCSAVGSIVPPTESQQAQGFVGYSRALFVENFMPAFQEDRFGPASGFMGVFGVFFPSVTGILAGTSITGDLKDPSGAIPKGELYLPGSLHFLLKFIDIVVTYSLHRFLRNTMCNPVYCIFLSAGRMDDRLGDVTTRFRQL
jgi:hypothetical protein